MTTTSFNTTLPTLPTLYAAHGRATRELANARLELARFRYNPSLRGQALYEHDAQLGELRDNVTIWTIREAELATSISEFKRSYINWKAGYERSPILCPEYLRWAKGKIANKLI